MKLKLRYDIEKKSQFEFNVSSERTIVSILNNEITQKISSIADTKDPSVQQIITTSKEVIGLLQLAFEAGLVADQTEEQKKNKENYDQETLSQLPNEKIQSLLKSYAELVEAMDISAEKVSEKTASLLRLQLESLRTSVEYAVDVNVGETIPKELQRSVSECGKAMKPALHSLKTLEVSQAVTEAVSQVISSDKKLKGRSLSPEDKRNLVGCVAKVLLETKQEISLKTLTGLIQDTLINNKVLKPAAFNNTRLKLKNTESFASALKEKTKDLPNNNSEVNIIDQLDLPKNKLITFSKLSKTVKFTKPEKNHSAPILSGNNGKIYIREDVENTNSVTSSSNESPSDSSPETEETSPHSHTNKVALKKKKLTSLSKLSEDKNYITQFNKPRQNHSEPTLSSNNGKTFAEKEDNLRNSRDSDCDSEHSK